MKKLLVISDTHGIKIKMKAVIRRFTEADMIIHLGDYSRDADYIRTLTDKPVYNVRGNCDLGSDAKAESLLFLEGVKILMVHGHKQSVKSSLLGLSLYAREKEANVV